MRSGFLFILGTRPEAIKLAPVILEAKKRNWPSTIVSTGQHPDLCTNALSNFDLTPDIKLECMQSKQNLVELSSKILNGLNGINLDRGKQVTIVQGDTTSALMGAYFAFLNGNDVVHIEAGLRTSNLKTPFPEELNRRLITRISSLHCAATELNYQNLISEGIHNSNISITGNPVIDSLKKFLKMENIQDKKNIIITLHRRENHGKNIQNCVTTILKIAEKYKTDFKFIFVKHPNPESNLNLSIIKRNFSNVSVIPPQPYPKIVALLETCKLLVTDSGGLQEEATFLGLPTIIVRNETERNEAVDSGVCEVSSPMNMDLENRIISLLEDENYYRSRSKPSTIFGNGSASINILDFIGRKYDL